MKGKTRLSMARIWHCVLIVLVLVLTPLSSPGGDLAKERSELVPREWAPSLEQIQTYIEDEFGAKAQKNQRFLTRTSQSMADLRDAQLFITYVLLMQALDAKERTDLFNEQKHWLSKREELARAAVKSKGGSLERLEYSSAFRKITEERLAKLEKRLAQKRTPARSNQGKEEK